MRPVTVFRYERSPESSYLVSQVEDGKGTFLAWGVDYEELENGVGTYTAAIVEMADGTVKLASARMIRFDDKEQAA